MQPYYLYLITLEDKFKVGITTNPKARYKAYKDHNPNCKMHGMIEVPNKEVEKSVHGTILKKGYRRCDSYKEWFLGEFNLKDLSEAIKLYFSNIQKCNL